MCKLIEKNDALDHFMSNSKEIRTEHYNECHQIRQQFCSNMFLSSVNEEAVKHFTATGPSSLFDDKKIYDKEKVPVMLDFLPDARTFLLQQSKPLQIKKCPFYKNKISCSFECKYSKELRDHMKICDGDSFQDSKGRWRPKVSYTSAIHNNQVVSAAPILKNKDKGVHTYKYHCDNQACKILGVVFNYKHRLEKHKKKICSKNDEIVKNSVVCKACNKRLLSKCAVTMYQCPMLIKHNYMKYECVKCGEIGIKMHFVSDHECSRLKDAVAEPIIASPENFAVV